MCKQPLHVIEICMHISLQLWDQIFFELWFVLQKTTKIWDIQFKTWKNLRIMYSVKKYYHLICKWDLTDLLYFFICASSNEQGPAYFIHFYLPIMQEQENKPEWNSKMGSKLFPYQDVSLFNSYLKNIKIMVDCSSCNSTYKKGTLV